MSSVVPAHPVDWHASRVPALLAAAFIAVVLAAGVYAAAAMMASWLASTLSVQETLHHGRAVELERASLQRHAAHARCARLEPRERDECSAVADRLQRSAVRAAVMARPASPRTAASVR